MVQFPPPMHVPIATADVELSTERILAAARTPPRPHRIACLTEETVEILYRLGAGDRVVGVSKYVVRPPEAATKPRLCAFVRADYAAVEAVRPDLVLCFSDLQAEIAAECARRGMTVVVFNQRSVADVLGVVRAIGAIVGLEARAAALVAELQAHLAFVAAAAARLPWRPRVHFEEWDDPLITAIRWVAELIELAGGTYVHPSRCLGHAARDRVVSADEVVAARPDVILASWCGKPVCLDAIRARPGFGDTPAVRAGRVHELPPSTILQPGPAALGDGLDHLHALIAAACAGR